MIFGPFSYRNCTFCSDLSQELNDWKGADTTNGQLSDAVKSEIRKRQEELARDRKCKQDSNVKIKQERLANKQEAMSGDWALDQTTRLGGYVFFQRDMPLKPLANGEQRYYHRTADLPDDIQRVSLGHSRRSCILSSDGVGRRLEISWSERGSSLHGVFDEGSSSWTFLPTM